MADGSVIVGGQMAPNTAHIIGTLDPLSGAFKQVASFPSGLLPNIAGNSAYSPDHNVFTTRMGTSTAAYWYWVSEHSLVICDECKDGAAY